MVPVAVAKSDCSSGVSGAPVRASAPAVASTRPSGPASAVAAPPPSEQPQVVSSTSHTFPRIEPSLVVLQGTTGS